MKCEYCGKEHSGDFATGRFCSRSCSNGFSTKNKRREINKKVSNKLKGKSTWRKGKKIRPRELLICPTCKKEFEFIIGYNRKYCSWGCSKNAPRPNNGGLREGGGHSKVYEYINIHNEKMKLNKDEIEIAKILDKLNLKWKRNWVGFKYITLEGKQRKYYPDFFIETYNIYLEYKGWITYEMAYKMQEAQKINNFKLLIVYSNDKRYKHLGLNLDQIINNPKLLYRSLVQLVEQQSPKL